MIMLLIATILIIALPIIYIIGKCEYNRHDEIIEIEYTDDDISYYDDSNFETIFGKGE